MIDDGSRLTSFAQLLSQLLNLGLQKLSLQRIGGVACGEFVSQLSQELH